MAENIGHGGEEQQVPAWLNDLRTQHSQLGAQDLAETVAAADGEEELTPEELQIVKGIVKEEVNATLLELLRRRIRRSDNPHGPELP